MSLLLYKSTLSCMRFLLYHFWIGISISMKTSLLFPRLGRRWNGALSKSWVMALKSSPDCRGPLLAPCKYIVYCLIFSFNGHAGCKTLQPVHEGRNRLELLSHLVEQIWRCAIRFAEILTLSVTTLCWVASCASPLTFAACTAWRCHPAHHARHFGHPSI